MAHTLRVGWHVLLDENEWDSDAEVVIPPAQESPHPVTGKRSLSGWYTAGVLLLLALAVGLRLWEQGRAGLAAVERGVSHTLALETEATLTGDELLASALLDPRTHVAWRNQQLAKIAEANARSSAEIEITEIGLYGDRAIAQVQVRDPESGITYRESRFYRETANGWLISQPVPELWGEPRALESEYFVFHFRRLDGAAVAEAAPVLDEAYMHLHVALGLPLPVASPSQAKIEVRVVAGGESYGAPWYRTGEPLWINSPLLLRLPDQLTDSQALAELVAFPIRRALVNRAMSPLGKENQLSSEFVSGLRLWLAWDDASFLSDHRAEWVSWLFANALDVPRELPITYLEVCGVMGVWQVVFPAAPVLFYCPDLPAALHTHIPPISLHHMRLSFNREELLSDSSRDPLTGELLASHEITPIVLATLLEYVTHTYGPDSVAALLQAAKQGENWRTVAPLLFGVSESVLERGWRDWLAEEYGVDTSEFIAAENSSQSVIVWDSAAARQALAEYQARLP